MKCNEFKKQKHRQVTKLYAQFLYRVIFNEFNHLKS